MSDDPVEAACEAYSGGFCNERQMRRAIAAWCKAEAAKLDMREFNNERAWLLERAVALRGDAS